MKSIKYWLNPWRFFGMLILLACIGLTVLGTAFAIMNPNTHDVVFGTIWALVGIVNATNIIKSGIFK